MWGWLLSRIDFQCSVLGKEKVKNRKERETAERGLGFSNIYLHLSVLEEVFFALMFFFFKYCVDVDNYGSLRGFGFI